MRIAICDDLPEERQIIREYLARYDREHNFEYTPCEYDSAERLLVGLSKEPVDLIFLDIYMTGMTGMDAAKLLLNGGFGRHIIFTTTSTDHAVDSYNLDVDGYIVKPFSFEAFSLRLNKVAKKWLDSFKSIEVRSDRLAFRIYLRDIDYIESGNHCTYIHARGTSVRASASIGQIEDELLGEPSFIRCGRGFIVNLNAVKDSDNEFIYMNNGDRILLPIRDKAKIRSQIANYYWSMAREMKGTHG